MQKVKKGEIKIKANEFSSFLYPEGTQYRVDNEFEGLFQGPLLLKLSISLLRELSLIPLVIQVFSCIFTGPLSALNKPKRGNKPSIRPKKNGKKGFTEDSDDLDELGNPVTRLSAQAAKVFPSLHNPIIHGY